MKPYSAKTWIFEISGFPVPIDQLRIEGDLAPKIRHIVESFGVTPSFAWKGFTEDNRPHILFPHALSEEVRERLKSVFRDVIGFHCVFAGSVE